MPPRLTRTLTITTLALASLTGLASAKSIRHRVGTTRTPDFRLDDAPIGGSKAPRSASNRAALQGSTVATYKGDVVVIDADSGRLIRTASDGVKRAELDIAPGAAQLVVDVESARAYVSDRKTDQVAVVDLSDGLKRVDVIRTRTEPYGLALTPDRSTLLVTSVADRMLSGYDTSTGDETWTMSLGPEPRGVALAPSGKEALVTFLTTGVVGRVDLGGAGQPSISYVSIDPAQKKPSGGSFRQSAMLQVQHRLGPSSEDQGKSFARNAFSAMFVGNGVAVVPHQVSTPHLGSSGRRVPSTGYGGGNGFEPPIAHRLAFLGMPESGSGAAVRTAFASTNLHQPRAMAYDEQADTLYVAGFGSDDIVAVANVSQASVGAHAKTRIVDGSLGCAPNGMAVDPADGQVVVFCALTRKLVRLKTSARSDGRKAGTVVATSNELAPSRLSASAQRGFAMFRRGNDATVSAGGAMSCSNCHAEGRADSLSWFLQGNILQTPLLSGRLVGAHPFKWDGKDPNLTASLTNTVKRLGGRGISPAQAKDLRAYLETLPPPRTPVSKDHDALARGKALFASDKTGCATCHYGPLLTDRKRHAMSVDLDKVDTPSLVGLASSAPYYHDGSAASLEALLKGRGKIHGMGRISRLSENDIDDLVEYLNSL